MVEADAVRAKVEKLERAIGAGENVYVVHYSCEDLNSAKDRPPAISVIALHDVVRTVTRTFSITDHALSGDDDTSREVAMIKDFFDALSAPQSHLVHWNMSRPDYGFDALAKRLLYLTGDAVPHVDEDRQYDLNAIIKALYGDDFAPHPRLRGLIDLNKIATHNWLSGPDEAARMIAGDINSLQRSAAEKTRILEEIAKRLFAGTLQTRNSAGLVDFADSRLDAVKVVLELGERFEYVRRSLLHRHSGRTTLEVTDEYDAQDLFRSLLALVFDEVAEEEWTPSYAGSSSRIDFLLKPHKIAIELKRTRDSLKTKELGEQLIIDISKYASHPDVSHLLCLVFDRDGLVTNPRGIERELSSADGLGLSVTARIYDR